MIQYVFWVFPMIFVFWPAQKRIKIFDRMCCPQKERTPSVGSTDSTDSEGSFTDQNNFKSKKSTIGNAGDFHQTHDFAYLGHDMKQQLLMKNENLMESDARHLERNSSEYYRNDKQKQVSESSLDINH
jgi:hypothetical protein